MGRKEDAARRKDAGERDEMNEWLDGWDRLTTMTGHNFSIFYIQCDFNDLEN